MSSQIEKNIDAKIEQLKLMIDIPRLFLIKYYEDLRNKIDMEYSKKEQKITVEEKKQWIEMIDKIDSLENENMKQLHPNPISETKRNQINSRIKEIQEKKDIKPEDELILDREIDEVKKILLLNKTISLFKYSDDDSEKDNEIKFIHTDMPVNKEDADKCYLLISNNHYLDSNRLFEAYRYVIIKNPLKKRRHEFKSIKCSRLFSNRNYHSDNLSFSRELLTHLFLEDKYESIQNQIIDIDLELSDSLEQIHGSSLRYESINFDTLRNLNSLTLLDLSKNRFENIDDFIFQDLISLKYLWLDNNLITSIGKNAFKSLSQLKWLDLSNNKIQSFDENTFKDLTSLEIIDLENNQIECIDPSIFQSNSKLRILTKTNHFTLEPVQNLTKEKTSRSKESFELFEKNLLKNSDAEHGFENWIPVRYHPQGIISLIKSSKMKGKFKYEFEIENEQDGVVNKMLKENNQTLYKNFVTSYFEGSKFQVIEISETDLNEDFFENYKPNIEIGENYFPSFNCDSLYYLNVYLVDEYFQIIDKYRFENMLKQGEVSVWQSVKHIFKYKEEFKSIKYILFYHCGKTKEYYHGNYGIKMTNGYIKLIKSSIMKDES